MADPKSEETYSPEETEARAAAALKRMLQTPHKPHKPLGKAVKQEQEGAENFGSLDASRSKIIQRSGDQGRHRRGDH